VILFVSASRDNTDSLVDLVCSRELLKAVADRAYGNATFEPMTNYLRWATSVTEALNRRKGKRSVEQHTISALPPTLRETAETLMTVLKTVAQRADGRHSPSSRRHPRLAF